MIVLCLLTLGALASAPFHGRAAEGENVVIRTPGSNPGAVIETVPETGTRVMRTPEPGEQESYQGPQTIIVSPEVFPGRTGNRPSSAQPSTPEHTRPSRLEAR